MEPQPDEAVDEMFREVQRSRAVPDGVSAFDATDTVLCALAMRLPRADAEDLAAVVPASLRRMISRCVVHEDDLPEISLDQRGFLNLIATRLRISYEAAERVTRSVFAAVQHLMPEDEIWDVRNRLPRDLDALWYPFTQSGRAAFEEVAGEPATDVLRRPRPLEEPVESILAELERSDVLPAGVAAPDAVRAVLCTLSLELTGAEARELAALGPSFHLLLDRCVAHRGERAQAFDQVIFIGHVANHLALEAADAERVTRAVFAALRGRLPAAEVAQIDNRVPRSVRRLWKPSGA
jgi:uncharacterized protein (DUF2267 family)